MRATCCRRASIESWPWRVPTATALWCSVLGGCGAFFQNDPVRTAEDFRSALSGAFALAFDEVVFAIADWSPERKVLGAVQGCVHLMT